MTKPSPGLLCSQTVVLVVHPPHELSLSLALSHVSQDTPIHQEGKDVEVEYRILKMNEQSFIQSSLSPTICLFSSLPPSVYLCSLSPPHLDWRQLEAAGGSRSSAGLRRCVLYTSGLVFLLASVEGRSVQRV